MSDDGVDRSLAAMLKLAGECVVLDLDVAEYAREHDVRPFIVLRDRGYTVVINPIPLTEYLNVDVHAFVDGEQGTAAVMGMNVGYTVTGFRAEQTPHRSNGQPSTNLVALFVGGQSTVTGDGDGGA